MTGRAGRRARAIPRSSERGVALVMAIVVLMVITILATMLMQSLSTERKISSHGLRASRALSVAEAGLAELESRVRSGEIALDESEPASAAQLFLTSPGALPALGADSTAYATLQPSGEWLGYSTPGRSADALTLSYRTDPQSGEIVRYDGDLVPPFNTLTGIPVLKARVVGLVSGDRVTVIKEFIPTPAHPTLSAAITSGVSVSLSGAFGVCGYQHSGATPFGHGALGRSASPACEDEEVGRGDVPAVWSGGTVSSTGASLSGSPSSTIEDQTAFYAGLYEALGLTSAEATTLLGTPAVSVPTPVAGVLWIDDNATPGDRSQSYAFPGLQGEGLVYVDGDLTLSGTVQFRGLLYVEGNFTSTATGQIIGGLVVRGRAGGTTTLTNGPAVLYSRDAVNVAVARARGTLVQLSWREVH